MFREGFLVRIKCRNFLTYDDTEFRPSEGLNVIIGPNGTGKSSVMCAIALCLGAKTSILGRAKSTAAFIKHGKDHAMVEIELKERVGQNTVVKYEIIRKITGPDDADVKFTINGQTTTLRAVEMKMERFKIQLSNMCQFLPQDKVADFAKMSPQEMLECTEKAVGGDALFDVHQELKKYRSDVCGKESDLKKKQEQLERGKSDISKLSREVEMFKLRAEQEKKIEVMRAYMPVLEANIMEKELTSVKGKLDTVRNDLSNEERTLRPLKIKQVQANKIKEKADASVKVMVSKIRGAVKDKTAVQVNLRKLEDERKQLDVDFIASKKEDADRVAAIAELETQLEVFKDELAAIPPIPESAVKDLTQKSQDCNDNINQVMMEKDQISGNKTKLVHEMRALENEQRRLNDVVTQRLDTLKRVHFDTYQAVLWLRQNQHLFTGHVHEPIMVLVNVHRPEYAKFIESHVAMKDLKVFVFESREDMNIFAREVIDKQKLSVNLAMTPQNALSEFTPTKKLDTYRAFGFHSFVKDLFTCPDAVMRYLCRQYNVHQILVGSSEVDNQTDQIMKKFPELRMFFTDKNKYAVKKSKYTGDASVMTTKLNNPKFMTATFNHERATAVMQELRVKQELFENFDGNLKRAEDRLRLLNTELNKYRAEKKALVDHRDRIRKLENHIKMRIASISNKKTEVIDLEKIKKNVLASKIAILRRKMKLLEKLSQINKEVDDWHASKIVNSIENAQQASIIAQLREDEQKASGRLRQLHAEVTELTSLCSRIETKLQRLMSSNEMLSDPVNVNRCKTAVLEVIESLPESLEELENKINVENIRMENTTVVDPEVVRELANRQKTLETLAMEVNDQLGRLNRKKKEVEEQKQSWLRQVQQMVGSISNQFSNFFKKIQCTGEVALHVPTNPEDFKEYGIRIRVKYRASEELMDLAAHHQSGGEKAVATILYIMSLQELTPCPLRCIDEINQGMDAMNEMRVFDLLVHTASRPNASQYFLLTPKLLPGLTYTKAVNILAVENSPEMRLEYPASDAHILVPKRSKHSTQCDDNGRNNIKKHKR